MRASLGRLGVQALIAIGGEDTLGVGTAPDDGGVPVVGVPKTIDNDLGGTDVTFGFQTAVQIATDAIDRLHTTAESHNRVMVVEVMGRHAGWIATYAGIAGGADAILVPERPFDIEEVCAHLRRRHERGRLLDRGRRRGRHAGEGRSQATGRSPERRRRRLRARAPGWHRGRARGRDRGPHRLRDALTILGHVQRGGTPVAFDRVLATRMGVAALDAVAARRFGAMVALRGNAIVEVALADALAEPRLLDPELYRTAELFFG